jgi:hypothetical protein
MEMSQQFQKNELVTPSFENRNYFIQSLLLEPKFVYQDQQSIQCEIGYKFISKKNGQGSFENAKRNAIYSAIKIEGGKQVFVNCKFNYEKIDFTGKPFSTISYIMLDGLSPGK